MPIYSSSWLYSHCADQNEEQSLGSSNIAELSPGAIDSCQSEYHAAFNSMMMERMTTDINALKKQYSRIKKKQQQQVHHVCIRAGNILKHASFIDLLQSNFIIGDKANNILSHLTKQEKKINTWNR